MKEINVSGEERSEFLKFIVDILVQSGQPYVHSYYFFGSYLLTASTREAAYEFRLAYAQSLPPSSELRQSAAADAIAAALRQPSILDFEPLCKIEAVIAAKDHELFPLLQIFLNNGLAEVQAFADSHAAVLETYR